MSRVSYYMRALLYMALAALPGVTDAIKDHKASVITTLVGVYAAALALRAFIDKSPAEAENAAPPAAAVVALPTGGVVESQKQVSFDNPS